MIPSPQCIYYLALISFCLFLFVTIFIHWFYLFLKICFTKVTHVKSKVINWAPRDSPLSISAPASSPLGTNWHGGWYPVCISLENTGDNCETLFCDARLVWKAQVAQWKENCCRYGNAFGPAPVHGAPDSRTPHSGWRDNNNTFCPWWCKHFNSTTLWSHFVASTKKVNIITIISNYCNNRIHLNLDFLIPRGYTVVYI